jgi:Zn-finger nucleic acid-binding protein
MQTVNLGSVALDRCEKHGVWFDANELTQLLKQVKQFKTHADEHEAHREGLLHRLAKLFG